MMQDREFIFIGTDGAKLEIVDCQTGSRTGDVYIDFYVPGDTAFFGRTFLLRGMFGGGWHSTQSARPNMDPHHMIRTFLIAQDPGEQQVDWIAAYEGETSNIAWRSLVDEDRSAYDCPHVGADFFIGKGNDSKEWVLGAVNRIIRDDMTDEEMQIFSQYFACAVPIKINTRKNPILEKFFQRLHDLGKPEDGYTTSLPKMSSVVRSERCEL